jgi:hypothetical protein
MVPGPDRPQQTQLAGAEERVGAALFPRWAAMGTTPRRPDGRDHSRSRGDGDPEEQRNHDRRRCKHRAPAGSEKPLVSNRSSAARRWQFPQRQ